MFPNMSSHVLKAKHPLSRSQAQQELHFHGGLPQRRNGGWNLRDRWSHGKTWKETVSMETWLEFMGRWARSVSPISQRMSHCYALVWSGLGGLCRSEDPVPLSYRSRWANPFCVLVSRSPMFKKAPFRLVARDSPNSWHSWPIPGQSATSTITCQWYPPFSTSEMPCFAVLSPCKKTEPPWNIFRAASWEPLSTLSLDRRAQWVNTT